jgi:hypothetical protein
MLKIKMHLKVYLHGVRFRIRLPYFTKY